MTKLNYQELINNATNCTFNVRTEDSLSTLSDAMKTNTYDFAKACFYLSKISNVTLEKIANLTDVSIATVGKHVKNIEYMLTNFNMGIDDCSNCYSVSKIDLIRKCKEIGCYKTEKNLSVLINKSRKNLENALKKASNTEETNTNINIDTDTIHAVFSDGRELNLPKSVVDRLCEKYAEKSE